MVVILEGKNALKLMNSLYSLFIYIRYKPDCEINENLIQSFHNALNVNMKFNNKEVIELINSLQKLRKHDFVDSIIGSLKQSKFTYVRSNKIIRVRSSIEPIRYILSQLQEKIRNKEYDKVRIMASSVHNYPHFIIGKYKCNSLEFWNEHIGYYTRHYQEPFMNEWEYLFKRLY